MTGLNLLFETGFFVTTENQWVTRREKSGLRV